MKITLSYFALTLGACSLGNVYAGVRGGSNNRRQEYVEMQNRVADEAYHNMRAVPSFTTESSVPINAAEIHTMLIAQQRQKAGGKPSEPGTIMVTESGSRETTNYTNSVGPSSSREEEIISYQGAVFQTWAEEQINYHGLCDFVLLENQGFSNNLGMDIHIRTKNSEHEWTYISNVVIRIGDETLEVMGSKAGGSHYWVNGELGEELKADHASLKSRISGYSVHFKRVNDKQHQYTINLGSQQMLLIKTWNDVIRVDVLGGKKESFAMSRGLMGKFKSGKHMARDDETELYDLNTFVQEWQVLASEPKLFHNVDNSQTCETAPPTARHQPHHATPNEVEISQDEAEIACARVRLADREMCVFDVMAMNDLSLASMYRD